MKKTALALTAALALSSFITPSASAAAFPDRPVRIVVPATAGGPSDLVARLMAERLGNLWGQSVVVENRTGGAQMIAARAVATAAPDGYSLLQGTSNMATNPIFHKEMPYDPADLIAVTRTHSTPMALVVHPSLPVDSVESLVAYIKKQPAELSFSTTGMGSSQQLAMLQLQQLAKLPPMTEVPYQGSSQGHPDLISGRVQLTIDPVAAVGPHIRSGAVKALAVTTSERLPSFPDIPTFAESGYPGVDLGGWGGVFVPSATPRPIVEQLRAAVGQVLEQPDVRQRMLDMGMVAQPDKDDAFQGFVLSERERLAKVVADAGLNPHEKK
ncbi:Bug family tripartite tricarboxylate transporter substrate binding protein [Paracandidimonas soli]|uniref:Bug family tripartite tricarboxylate transporter substrate binding protein n=1 Tax=Paracandidimonas soli TaxID=1917182 RepID=UPI00334021F3